jgi:hypothetical protein
MTRRRDDSDRSARAREMVRADAPQPPAAGEERGLTAVALRLLAVPDAEPSPDLKARTWAALTRELERRTHRGIGRLTRLRIGLGAAAAAVIALVTVATVLPPTGPIDAPIAATNEPVATDDTGGAAHFIAPDGSELITSPGAVVNAADDSGRFELVVGEAVIRGNGAVLRTPHGSVRLIRDRDDARGSDPMAWVRTAREEQRLVSHDGVHTVGFLNVPVETAIAELAAATGARADTSGVPAAARRARVSVQLVDADAAEVRHALSVALGQLALTLTDDAAAPDESGRAVWVLAESGQGTLNEPTWLSVDVLAGRAEVTPGGATEPLLISAAGPHTRLDVGGDGRVPLFGSRAARPDALVGWLRAAHWSPPGSRETADAFVTAWAAAHPDRTPKLQIAPIHVRDQLRLVGFVQGTDRTALYRPAGGAEAVIPLRPNDAAAGRYRVEAVGDTGLYLRDTGHPGAAGFFVPYTPTRTDG